MPRVIKEKPPTAARIRIAGPIFGILSSLTSKPLPKMPIRISNEPQAKKTISGVMRERPLSVRLTSEMDLSTRDLINLFRRLPVFERNAGELRHS